MPGDLGFCAPDDEPGAIRRIVGDQLVLLADLLRQRGDEALLLELGGDTIRDIRDRLGLTLAGLLEARCLLLAQFGEVECPFTIIGRMRFVDHPLYLVDKAIRDAFGRAELLDELLGQIPGARKRHMAVGIVAVERAGDRRAAAPGQRRCRVADQPARTRQERRTDVFVGIPAGGRDRIATCGDDVRERGLSRAPCADDGNKARVERNVRCGCPIRIINPDMRNGLGRHCRARRLLADISSAVGIDAGLPESVKLQRALDP